jgi:hypothetical protein
VFLWLDYFSLVRTSSVPKGFRITTRARLLNVFVFQNCGKKQHRGGVPLLAPEGGSVLKARSTLS